MNLLKSTDVTLFTSHQQIERHYENLSFFDINYRVHRYKHLIVSPHKNDL
jgi:polyphosphate kinase